MLSHFLQHSFFTTARGATVNGSISLSGGFVSTGDTKLGYSTGVDFLEWNGTSSANRNSAGSFTVTSVTDDFANYVTASPFTPGNIKDF